MTSKYDIPSDDTDYLAQFVPGVIRSPHDPRDYIVIPQAVTLPNEYELPADIPIKNQGSKGACAAFAGMRVREGEYLRSRVAFDGSEEALYGCARDRDYLNSLCYDSGAVPRDIMDILVRIGCLSESERPYSMDLCKGMNTAERQAASSRKVREYARLGNMEMVKSFIYTQQRRVTICLLVHENFIPDANGYVPLPRGLAVGWHLITCEGWNQLGLRVSNSWSTRWGLNGYCYLPNEYAMIPAEQGGIDLNELWTLIDADPNPEVPPTFLEAWNYTGTTGWQVIGNITLPAGVNAYAVKTNYGYTVLKGWDFWTVK